MIKKLASVLIILFVCSLPVKAQFSESKERKKMWHKSKHRRKNREAFNPYLEKKNKDKPSSIEAQEEKKNVGRMKRDHKRQTRRNMRKLGIKPTKVKKA